MTGINAAELRNVCKVRKDFKIDNVSFKLPSGTITGFVGENGAGKTTVIELILDIIKRDSGEILVFGMDNITHRSEIHEDIGVVFDTVKFPDTLTACDLNKIMSGIYKNWDEDEFVGYCARFALPIDKKFARFSRGMTMKLSLAAAFSHKAKLLILDEPTGGLDPAARNEILDIIQEFVCDEKVKEACRAVGLDHFIKTLSHGYDTILNDQVNLSQGQKQQLTIARAMIADKPMLILDEATSSVDTRTELQIQDAMDKLMADRTSFVIAHRLSTIKNADLILVMKDGDIIEKGTHEELLAKKGFYADLYNSQFEQAS